MKVIDTDKIAAEIKKQGPLSALEKAIMDELLSFAKTLPPLPEGYGYGFVPAEPEYNRDADEWEVTIKAEVRRI